MPRSYPMRHGHAERIELARDRVFRTRNTPLYRLAHWPIWIWVFFIAPGPVTFDLFAHGFDRRMALWLGVVLVGTGVAGLRGKLPGDRARAIHLHEFNEDRPNPLYRRLCYTLAWSEVVSYAVLNIVGIVDAILHGTWRLRFFYDLGYLPIAGTCWVLGALGCAAPRGLDGRPRGRPRATLTFTARSGPACLAQPDLLWLLWGVFPKTRPFDVAKLVIFVGILALVGDLARRGRLPRTRPILPGEGDGLSD